MAVDPGATTAFIEHEAAVALDDNDGHRAWVVRDTFEKLPPANVARLRAMLAGVRKRPGAPSTSRASAAAADFVGLGLGVPPAERPAIVRA